MRMDQASSFVYCRERGVEARARQPALPADRRVISSLECIYYQHRAGVRTHARRTEAPRAL